MPVPERKILIVDDSPEDRETWRRHLGNDPLIRYVVVERGLIEAGLIACREERPDCILLDHNLPDGTGLDFLEGLKELGGTLVYPTVMLTGTGSESVAVEALKGGAQDYLMKNRLQPEALHRAINAAVYKATTDRLLARQRVELEAAYREAQEANARKDQFLATLSHELRTPLTPILAVVSGLDVAHASVPELEETFRLIRRNVELEARLIDDLLDITRIAHGKLELNPQVVDVHELIRHTLSICGSNAQNKRVGLSSELDAGQHVARADAARLQQVCWNLLNNAIKFTPSGGSVRVATRNPAEGRLEIEVADTGMGITPGKVDKIFNAFEQGGGHVTREFGGLGLGLAICKALVEAHGGQIEAKSRGLNAGATFRVDLPVLTGGVAAERNVPREIVPKPAPAVAEAVSWSVLLVEDHEDSALALSALLRRRGYQVFHAATVAEAVALYQSSPVDAIISDLGLPDGNGLDLIRQLQAIRAVPSIILSGHGEADAVASSLEAGVQEHLTKPVEWPRLEAALQRVLQHPA